MQKSQSASKTKNQSNLDVVYSEIIKKEPKAYIEQFIIKNSPYDKFKYNQIIYSIGDCLMINDCSETFAIAELIRIIPTNGIKEISYWPSIEVRWFYKKDEINRKKNKIDDELYNAISNFEVFKSNHIDIILIESVINQCKVLSIEDYLINPDNSDTTFFSKALYDHHNQLLYPSPEEWERLCSCNMPVDPDLLCVYCEGCTKWFHPKCQGISGEITDPEFYCNVCKSKFEKE